MKTKVTVLVIIGILLTSCGAETAAQETEVTTEAFLEVSITEVSMTQIPVAVVTEEPTETDTPTKVPIETPLACMTLVAPENDADLPVTGKVTFSWTPVNEAGSYVISFILPSGSTVSFDTDQTFRDRYMEAFITGGEYQWQVTAQGTDGSEICISEVFSFDKPAYEKYEKPKGGDNDGGNTGESEEQPTECPPEGCGGNT